jgi:hypothetical protein
MMVRFEFELMVCTAAGKEKGVEVEVVMSGLPSQRGGCKSQSNKPIKNKIKRKRNQKNNNTN